MQQKTTWMRYLTLGISVIGLFLLTQCVKKTDYLVKGTFVYFNNTNSIIDVQGLYSFTLNPKESHTIEESTEGPDKVTPQTYVSPFNTAFIIYDNILCDTLDVKDEGITGLNNYTNEKLDERHYKFTYTFTGEDYNKAKPCN